MVVFSSHAYSFKDLLETFCHNFWHIDTCIFTRLGNKVFRKIISYCYQLNFHSIITLNLLYSHKTFQVQHSFLTTKPCPQTQRQLERNRKYNNCELTKYIGIQNWTLPIFWRLMQEYYDNEKYFSYGGNKNLNNPRIKVCWVCRFKKLQIKLLNHDIW